MSLMTRRTSVREFTSQEVSEVFIKKLLISGMQAPSSKNQQPWDFIIVDDRNLLDYMATMHSGAWPLHTATIAIIPVLRPTDRSPLMAAQDISAATENILLEATNLDLGAVWIGVYPLEERIAHLGEMFAFPEGHVPFAVIAVGHPLKEKIAKIRYEEKRVFRNKWGK